MKICGKGKFQDVWSMVSLDYTRELNFHARVERLKEVQNGLDQYFDKVYAVSERKPSPTEVLQGFRKNLRFLERCHSEASCSSGEEA